MDFKKHNRRIAKLVSDKRCLRRDLKELVSFIRNEPGTDVRAIYATELVERMIKRWKL